jgi:hypothetical protein
LLTKYDLYDQIKEDEMGGASCTCVAEDFSGELEGNLCLEDLGIDGSLMLKCILNE